MKLTHCGHQDRKIRLQIELVVALLSGSAPFLRLLAFSGFQVPDVPSLNEGVVETVAILRKQLGEQAEYRVSGLRLGYPQAEHLVIDRPQGLVVALIVQVPLFHVAEVRLPVERGGVPCL